FCKGGNMTILITSVNRYISSVELPYIYNNISRILVFSLSPQVLLH
uniref:Uncharacterized protein n=1 Tax=Pelodiscus sinensis TaxID=13735 RepID=K7G1Z7_PELSI